MLEYESNSQPNKPNDNKLEARINDLDLSYENSNNQSEDNLTAEDAEKLDKNENNINKTLIIIKKFFISLKNIFVSNNNIDVNLNNNGVSNLGGIKFHINTREAKPVEILLQRMFSNELDISNGEFINS
jgi:hypothetical protein